jgi:hypothetical protein
LILFNDSKLVKNRFLRIFSPSGECFYQGAMLDLGKKTLAGYFSPVVEMSLPSD